MTIEIRELDQIETTALCDPQLTMSGRLLGPRWRRGTMGGAWGRAEPAVVRITRPGA